MILNNCSVENSLENTSKKILENLLAYYQAFLCVISRKMFYVDKIRILDPFRQCIFMLLFLIFIIHSLFWAPICNFHALCSIIFLMAVQRWGQGAILRTHDLN